MSKYMYFEGQSLLSEEAYGPEFLTAVITVSALYKE